MHESKASAYLGYITPGKHTLENADLVLILASFRGEGFLRDQRERSSADRSRSISGTGLLSASSP
jgi:hypothetical protein